MRVSWSTVDDIRWLMQNNSVCNYIIKKNALWVPEEELIQRMACNWDNISNGRRITDGDITA